jgi:glutathione S-transferase
MKVVLIQHSGRRVPTKLRRKWNAVSAKVKAFARLAKFAPYVAGDKFTLADCAACIHLPIVSLATRLVLGRDFLEEIPAVKPYLKMMAERPHLQRVHADRKVNTELMIARSKA